MSPHAFSHIYEIFATFTLAYIIIDEFGENPFVSIISEKILKKYKPIDLIFKEVLSRIEGFRISFGIIRNNEGIHHIELKQGRPIKAELRKNEFDLHAIESRVDKFFASIKKEIKQNYRTRIFVFLNCFLLLYCLTMLFYGGLYSEILKFNGALTKDLKLHISEILLSNERLDSSIFLFSCGSLLLLIAGWALDKTMAQRENSDNPPASEPFYIRNGYQFIGIYFLVLIIFSILTYYCRWSFSIDFTNTRIHDLLILVTVFFPVSNFVVYFFKANMRANTCLPRLTKLVTERRDDFIKEAKKIEDFIGGCSYITPDKIVVVNKDEPQQGDYYKLAKVKLECGQHKTMSFGDGKEAHEINILLISGGKINFRVVPIEQYLNIRAEIWDPTGIQIFPASPTFYEEPMFTAKLREINITSDLLSKSGIYIIKLFNNYLPMNNDERAGEYVFFSAYLN